MEWRRRQLPFLRLELANEVESRDQYPSGKSESPAKAKALLRFLMKCEPACQIAEPFAQIDDAWVSWSERPPVRSRIPNLFHDP